VRRLSQGFSLPLRGEGRAAKLRLPSDDPCDSGRKGMSHVRGETPTRAGPSPVRKRLTALRRVTGRGARTRVAPRGAVTKWSVSGEPVRFRMVASQIGAPVPFPRVAREPGRFPLLSPPGCSWIGLADAVRVDRGRQARRQPSMTAGTLTPSEAGRCPAEVTSRYKRCEIRLGSGGEAGGLSRLLGGLSISRLRPRTGVGTHGVVQASAAGDRGE